MNLVSVTDITPSYLRDSFGQGITAKEQVSTNQDSFAYAMQQAMDMIKETNQLSNEAEVEEINFALGYSDNTHDLQIAQEKANIALQYTIAVRDRFLESYQSIMNMQM